MDEPGVLACAGAWLSCAVAGNAHSNKVNKITQGFNVNPPCEMTYRGEFALVGLFKFHSVSLGGRLYPLPRRATFRLSNVLHLMEARNRVAHVRGISSGSLRCLGKANLVADIPSRAALVSFAIVFLPREYLPAPGRPRYSLPRITTAFSAPAAWCG